MKRPSRYFRAGVGAVITDGRGHVLALERSDFRGAWQLPQGGLKKGETPLQAVFREIEEETGISRRQLTLLGKYPELLAYELPVKVQSKRTGMGQVQQWYFLKLRGDVSKPPAVPNGEFRDARWVAFSRVVSGAPAFRKAVYQKLREFFDATGGVTAKA